MPSDVIIVQIIASLVTIFTTLIGLWVHRSHGSKESKEIKTLVNGQRTDMLSKIEGLEKRLVQLTGENIKLTAQVEDKTVHETDSP